MNLRSSRLNPLRDPARRSIVLLVLAFTGIAIGLGSAVSLVGKTARIIDVFTIFVTALGAGASLVDAVRLRRDVMREKKPHASQPQSSRG